MRAAALAPLLLTLALALETSGSLELRAEGRYSSGAFSLEPVYGASLLAAEHWGDAYAEVALYPRWDPVGHGFDAGVSKLEVGYAAAAFALGAGAGPEPLATLRLLRTHALAPPRDGFAPGLWGAWAEVYPGPSTRLRFALRWQDDRPLALLRADGGLGGFDCTLAAVYGAPAASALGAGASVRLDEWILYAEAWRRLEGRDPWRGGFGFSRYVFGGLLTAEAGYREGWQLAAAYALQAGDAWSLDALVRGDWSAGRIWPAALVRIVYQGGEGDVVLGLGYLLRPGRGGVLRPSLGARVYY